MCVWPAHQSLECITKIQACFPTHTLSETQRFITIASSQSILGYLAYNFECETQMMIQCFESLESVHDDLLIKIMIDCAEQIAIYHQIPYIIIESTIDRALDGFKTININDKRFQIKTTHHNESRS